jgi:hypothetical protein
MGSQKVPRTVILHWNGSTHHAYLITNTLAPSILPLLEAAAEGLFWHLLEFCHCNSYDVLHGCKMCPLEANFQSRAHLKVTWSKTRRKVWWLGDDRNIFLSEELPHKWCVALPCVVPLLSNCNLQPLQNLHIEITSNNLSWHYKLTVHQTIYVNEFWEHFDCTSFHSTLWRVLTLWTNTVILLYWSPQN